MRKKRALDLTALTLAILTMAFGIQPSVAEVEAKTDGKSDGKPTVTDLKTFYNQGKYKEVLSCVKSMHPTCMTHYYTGLAYQGLNQNYRAALEYNYVSKFAKDKTLKNNASRALKSLYKVKRSKKAPVDDLGNEIEFQRIPENHYPGGPAPADALHRIRQETRRQQRVHHPNRDRYGNWHRNKQQH